MLTRWLRVSGLAPAWVPLLVFAACADADTTAPTDDACDGGQAWELGLLGSEEMNPGEPCLSCHGADATPSFAAAGTVFDTFDAADDCYGAAEVTVEVEDATGLIVTTTTNAAGNFYFEDVSLTLPIIARVSRNGETRTMPRFVHATDCNDCHSQTGKFGAPGRVRAP